MKLKRLFQLITISLLFMDLGLPGIICKTSAADTDGNSSCIPLENAAAILGVPLDDLRASGYDLMVSPDDHQNKVYKYPPHNCAIRSTSDFLKSLTYVTYVYNDPGLALKEFNQMKNGFATVSKVDVVADTGDEAFWAGDDRFQRMVAIKGCVVIDVLSPKDFILQKQAIDLVLKKF